MSKEMMTKDNQNIFQENIRDFASVTNDFVENFYPAYTIKNDYLEASEKENSYEKFKEFTFFKLTECTIYNVENKFEYFAKKIQKLVMTYYSINRNICYGIISSNNVTSLVIGVSGKSEDKQMKTIIEGLLPGMTLQKYEMPKQVAKDYDRHAGCMAGIPTIKKNEEYKVKDIASLIRSLHGKEYTIMVMCRPLNSMRIQDKINRAIKIQDDCFKVSKKTLSLQTGNSAGQTASNSVSDTDSKSTSKSNGMNGSPLVATAVGGAALGFAIGTPVPVVGNIVGALAGGLIGVIAGSQFSLSRSTTKGTSTSHTIGYSEAITKTVSENDSIAVDIQNGFAIELMQMSEQILTRFKNGRNIGMWEMLVSYSADTKEVLDIIQGNLYSELAEVESETLPPLAFSTILEKTSSYISESQQHVIIPKNFFESDSDSQLGSFVTSEELCGIFTIPQENTVGFEIKESKNYSLSYSENSNEQKIGNICEFDNPVKGLEFGFSESDLNKHTFVCGITGSGKTNTVKTILEKTNKPFMVIEPAKKEYRNINKQVQIYTIGKPQINCIKLNPFYILPGINPQQHIDMLKDLFNASFAFHGPMPYIFEKCLYNIYTKKGWDLTLGFHPHLVNKHSQIEMFDSEVVYKQYARDAHKYIFPNMQDLKAEVDYYIEHEMTYDNELKGNIRSALKSRIDSLCVGAKGYMFNTYDVIDFQKLFSENAILELEGLADDADKSFCLGLLIIFTNQYRQVQKESKKNNELEHLIVIEEAHRLLENISNEKSESFGNPKGKAVQHFTNMLAEMRSYGQGIIVVEQIPTKIAVDVIKNSSNKIIHRIISKDDQEVIANTIGIGSDESIYIGHNTSGYALCHKEGMTQPVQVQVFMAGTKYVDDGDLYKKDLARKMKELSQSLAMNNLASEIEVVSIQTLVSLLYQPDAKELFNSLQKRSELLHHELQKKAVTLIPGININEIIFETIFDTVSSLLTHGVFSSYELPSNELILLLKRSILAPSRDGLRKLASEFESFYAKNPENRIVHTVASLLIDDYRTGEVAIEKNIADFCLVKNDRFIHDVKKKMSR